MSDTSDRKEPSLGHDSLTRLLQLGLRPGQRPVDELLDWLALDEGREWFRRWCEAPLGSLGTPRARLIEAHAHSALETLRAFYGEAKKLLGRAKSKEDRLAALAAYFLANAAALAAHGQSLSSRSRDELEPILVDLAGALPEPWDDLVEKAVAKLGGG